MVEDDLAALLEAVVQLSPAERRVLLLEARSLISQGVKPIGSAELYPDRHAVGV